MNHLDTIIHEPQQPANKTIIWLHGLGANNEDFAPVPQAMSFAENTNVRFIFPNAPVIPVTLNQGMEMRAWYDIIDIGATAQQDSKGMQANGVLLAKIVDQQIKDGINPKDIIIGGFSQGGALALHFALRYSESLGGAFGLSTYLPDWEATPQERHTNNHDTPIFLCGGEQDTVVEFVWTQMTKEVLTGLNYHVTWHQYPMMHEVCPEEIQDLNRWVNNIFSAGENS